MIDEQTNKQTNKQKRMNTNYCNKVGNGIGVEGIRLFIESLKINNALTGVNLRGKDIIIIIQGLEKIMMKNRQSNWR